MIYGKDTSTPITPNETAAMGEHRKQVAEAIRNVNEILDRRYTYGGAVELTSKELGGTWPVVCDVKAAFTAAGWEVNGNLEIGYRFKEAK